MHSLKKLMALILVMLMANLSVSSVVHAKAKITKNKPVVMAPPEVDIPVETVTKKGGSGWLWVLLGAAVVAGGVAVAGAGGSDDSSSSSSSGGSTPSGETGNVSVSW